MWKYDSPIGELFIAYVAKEKGYFIAINGEYCGKYESVVAAADDVYTFSTGCDEWDKHCDESRFADNVPSSIHEWVKVPNDPRF